MVIELYKENQDFNGMRVSFRFVNSSGELLAAATDNIGEDIYLFIGDEKYVFRKSPKVVNKKATNFIYPLSNHWKRTLGFEVLRQDERIAFFYLEAHTIGRGKIFKKNISSSAWVYGEDLYYCFRVGFPKERDHYYCLYHGEKLIGVIQRHYLRRGKGNCIATLYVEDVSNLRILLFACVDELVWVSTAGDVGERVDTSATGYISRYKEERELLDKNFIIRVQEQESKQL